MDSGGQDKHLFILDSYCAEAPTAKKIDSGMYMSSLNTAEASVRGGGGAGALQEGRAETLTTSLRDVRIFLMPYDVTGIYSGGGEKTELRRSAPYTRHDFTSAEGKNTALGKFVKHHLFLGNTSSKFPFPNIESLFVFFVN